MFYENAFCSHLSKPTYLITNPDPAATESGFFCNQKQQNKSKAMKIQIKYFNANFRHLPLSAKNPNREPYGIIEFMGGSQMCKNLALFPETENCDEILCEGSYMGQNIRVDGVLDVRKGGKSVLKEMAK